MFIKYRGLSGLAPLLLALAVFQVLFARCAAKESQAPLSTSNISKVPWKRCGILNDHTLECSRLEVPMDHIEKSSNGSFSIPLIRMIGKNASISGDRHILLNPGGPGGSGTEFLRSRGESLNKVVGESFHLLSFDPRGVNGSVPRAICYPTEGKRADSFLNVPWHVEFEAGEMFTMAENKAKACHETMGEHGKYLNTPQTAADMDFILDALGQTKMFYWGFSYGTTLGQTYAQMFPWRVEKLVIDGVSNLDEWYNRFTVEEDLDDTDRVFTGFVEECFAANEACPLNYIKDEIFKSSNELQAYIENFLDTLEEAPIPVYLNNSNYGAVTRRNLVTNGIFPALYKPYPAWPRLAANLAALLNGNSTLVYNDYSDSWIASVLGDETNTFVTMNDIVQTGTKAPVHGIQPIKNYTLMHPRPSNLVSKYSGSVAFDRASWVIPTTHAFRPQYYPEFPRFKTAEPILVISKTWDPVCPLVSARKAHNSFSGAGLLEQLSYGHCSISMPSLCTAKYVRNYFNEGVLPGVGAKCKIDAEYFPINGREPLLSTLSQEDRELLAALSELAIQGTSSL